MSTDDTKSSSIIFMCARCGEEFESDWSEEEALEEKNRLFGAVPIEQCSVVCDDCFKIIMRQ